MSRFYRVPFNGTISNAGGNVDLLLALPADDKPIRLVGWEFGQTSEVGDAAEEGLRITVRHLAATVTNGSGGSAVTPVANHAPLGGAGFTTRTNDTTVATSSGTDTVVHETAWNIRNTPWEKWIPEELRPEARQAEALVVRIETTPADDFSFAGTFFIEEM